MSRAENTLAWASLNGPDVQRARTPTIDLNAVDGTTIGLSRTDRQLATAERAQHVRTCRRPAQEVEHDGT